PFGSRDHTERMLPRFGARIDVDGNVISLEPGALTATHIAIPGDPSSAAFLVAAALLVPGSRVNLPNIGTNPTRTGFFTLLDRMGARIEWRNERMAGGEPLADLRVG